MINTKKFKLILIILEFVVNGISIMIYQLHHWINFYEDAVLGIFQYFGFFGSLIIPSEPINWDFLFQGTKLMISAFLIQIVVFILTFLIAEIIDY